MRMGCMWLSRLQSRGEFVRFISSTSISCRVKKEKINLFICIIRMKQPPLLVHVAPVE